MSEKSLVIVESPTKAKTITKFLGKDFLVKASNGHIRDLPNSAAEIPEKLKKEEWAKLGVNVNDNFEPLYVVPPGKKENVKILKEAIKNASNLYLATDEDREGESISWHLFELLQPKIPTKRLVFHEITKDAIKHALESARDIDQNLVKAQETRRIVDRLFGYQVSPLLWKKMAPGLSAGRVQSVAVRLLVDRERERTRFHSADYWDLKAVFAKKVTDSSSAEFEAELTHVLDKRIASGKDFDPDTGKLKTPGSIVWLNEHQAAELRDKCLRDTPKVVSVEEKPFTTSPAPPFVTSTIQQEANRKLRFSAKHTMSIAQKLYENGFITYMRTDSTTLSEEALLGARNFIKRDYGEQFLPSEPRIYKTKVKNAQEAHEAIRPAGEEFTSPEIVKEQLGLEAFRLYDLIWKRTVASQMANARGTYISVHIACGDAKFRASGKTIEFPGFLRAYVEGSDDPEADIADQEKILPKLAQGELLSTSLLESIQRSTQAPARYTEGSLIKELELRGIGRPSTWASIVELVLSRSYAFKKGTALVPSFVAMAVVGLLEKQFKRLLDYEFTARLEDDLDSISRGEADNVQYLTQFYFGNGHPGLKKLVEMGEKEIDPREVCGIAIGKDDLGKIIEVRIGRYGPFITNGELRASLPDMLPPDELTIARALEILVTSNKEPEPLGIHPTTNEPIFLKSGPYGPYIELGGVLPETPEEPEVDTGKKGKKKKKEKPKRVLASLLPNTKPEEVDLEYALKLLSLPRNLGAHPEMNEEIIAANGRFGPYIKCGTETRSIPLDTMSPLDISFDQAIALLKEPKRQGRSSTPKILKEVGKHPITEKLMSVKSGRYGPYVTDGELNASLQKGQSPETLTVEDAVNLLAARADKIAADGGATKKKRAKKTVKKEPEKKTTTAKSKPKAKAKS